MNFLIGFVFGWAAAAASYMVWYKYEIYPRFWKLMRDDRERMYKRGYEEGEVRTPPDRSARPGHGRTD